MRDRERLIAFWVPQAGRAVLIGIVGLLTGLAVGARAGWAVSALLLAVVLLSELHQLSRLLRWLEAPHWRDAPDASGAWGEAFAALARTRRVDERAHARMAAAVERLGRAAQALPDGVVLLDAQDRIEWCNRSAGRLLGLDRERDHGLPLANLVRQPEFVAYLRQAEHEGTLVLRGAGAERRTIAVDIVPFAESGRLVVARDVSATERADTMRREFVANVSHELRTPLTVINGFLEMWSDGGGVPPSGQLVLALEQSRRMARLVEDLLTLSRLEAANEPSAESEIDMPALVDTLAEEARTLSGGRHRVEASADAAGLRGNREELRTAFTNLLTNAIRYTPAGGRVSLAWTADGSGARFAVSDSGEGIAPEHIPRLTERFYRVDRSRSRETGGTGLGLAIVKHVLLRHQAHLEIESRPGHGSTFGCRFPAERVLPAAGAAADAAIHERAARGAITQRS